MANHSRASSRRRLRLHVRVVSAATAAAIISHTHPAAAPTNVVLAFQFCSSSTRAAHLTNKSRQRRDGRSSPTSTTALPGWLDNFLPKPYDAEASARADARRRQEYPEQYPATYELLPPSSLLPQDGDDPTGALVAVRPLLKRTQLECRPLRIAYDANVHGWDAAAFHRRVDGCGAAVILATADDGRCMVGGYNPKGWAGLGGARPSVAAFLFYQKMTSKVPTEEGDDEYDTDNVEPHKWQKLTKVGGGGLACANDDPSGGIYFGPDGLVIPLRAGDRARMAQSKLGPYFERGPEDLSSVFPGGAAVLEDLKVVVGIYEDGEDIPYSGGVMDMTSG